MAHTNMLAGVVTCVGLCVNKWVTKGLLWYQASLDEGVA